MGNTNYFEEDLTNNINLRIKSKQHITTTKGIEAKFKRKHFVCGQFYTGKGVFHHKSLQCKRWLPSASKIRIKN